MSKDSRQLNFVEKEYQRYNWFTRELLQEWYSNRNDERNLVQKQKSKFEIPKQIFDSLIIFHTLSDMGVGGPIGKHSWEHFKLRWHKFANFSSAIQFML